MNQKNTPKKENSSKKARKAKNKRGAKKTVGAVQANNPQEVWECVLYLRGASANCLELAHGAYVVKGVSGCVSKVRPSGASSAMCYLQYLARRERSRLLRPNAKGNRAKANGKVGSRQKGKRKSSRLLSKSNSNL